MFLKGDAMRRNDLSQLRISGGVVYLAGANNNNAPANGEPAQESRPEQIAAVVCYSSEMEGDTAGPVIGVWCSPGLARRITARQVQSLGDGCSECGLEEITVVCSSKEHTLCIYSAVHGNMRSTITKVVQRFIALLRKILSDILLARNEILEVIESRLPTRVHVGKAIGIA